MLVFILNAWHHAFAEATRANLAHIAPSWSIEFIGDQAALSMNKRLQPYTERFFITLQAGDLLHPNFVTELDDRLAVMPERCAGLIYERAHSEQPGTPLVWRTSAVQEENGSLFPERDQLPFDAFALFDHMLQLQSQWSWTSCQSNWWKPQRLHSPAWRHMQQERQLIGPILNAGSSNNTIPQTSNQPDFSVVISTYNNADYLPWAIRSVQAQDCANWELIIVDDASTDSTPHKLAALPADPRFRIYTNASNLGKSHSLNLALSVCKATWLLELDADDWLSPHSLSTFRKQAATSPETALLYADHHEWTERVRGKLIYSGVRTAPANIQPDVLLQRALPVAPRCYRTDVLHELQGWRMDVPHDGRLYEDFEILIRLSAHSPTHYVPQPLYHRRVRASSITQQNADKYAAWKSWMIGQSSRNLEEGGNSHRR